MTALGLKVYRLYRIPNYPADLKLIVSDEGYGRSDYIETTRSLVVVTAPGPGSGKMATCLSQLYPRAQARHQGRGTRSLRRSPSGTCRSSTR